MDGARRAFVVRPKFAKVRPNAQTINHAVNA
jgi:hypothetical protein